MAIIASITQERLKEVLDYDPETGHFAWKVNRGRVKAGTPAGGVHTGITGLKHIQIMIDGSRYYAHRLAWLYSHGEFPPADTDHINKNGMDNRIENLRCVSHSKSLRNSTLSSNNTSGNVGVSWNKPVNKWVARIRVLGKRIHLGYFDSKDDAILARKAGSIKYGFHQNHGKKRITL